MSIKQHEKRRLIGFISNMKQTGITAYDALDHFAKKMTNNVEFKKAVERIAKEVRKGFDIEAMLHKEKIIDDFQYAILKNSKDKNAAYGNVMHYTSKAAEADLVYIKNFLKVIAVWIGCLLMMAFLFSSYEQTLTLLEEIKEDYHVIPGTVTQYIELKDKNDKEIYVGHKVKCNQYHNNYLVEKNIVITVDNLWSRLRTDSTLRDFEIIGDVFNYEILNHPWLREYMDDKKIISCFDVNSDDFKTWSETKRKEFESYVESILFEEEKSCLN